MNKYPVKLGSVLDVKQWPNAEYSDERGKLSKVFADSDKKFGDISFNTIEHFFTTSRKNTFRGMHLQWGLHPVSKIVTLIQGSVIDYLLDLRANSKTYGYLQVTEMKNENTLSIFIPPGVAHGYLVLKDETIFSYRQDGVFCSECDTGVNVSMLRDFIDADLSKMILSPRDLALPDALQVDLVIRNHN